MWRRSPSGVSPARPPGTGSLVALSDTTDHAHARRHTFPERWGILGMRELLFERNEAVGFAADGAPPVAGAIALRFDWAGCNAQAPGATPRVRTGGDVSTSWFSTVDGVREAEQGYV